MERENLKVITLQSSNFRDVPQTLRNIADGIESGNFGDVLQMALVLQGSQLDVFHAGQGDAESAHLLLACGQRKFEHAILSACGGYNFNN
jgi:hypothetical protein